MVVCDACADGELDDPQVADARIEAAAGRDADLGRDAADDAGRVATDDAGPDANASHDAGRDAADTALLDAGDASGADATAPRKTTLLQLNLPPTIYAVPDVPLTVYFDNLVLTEHAEQYRFDVIADVGASNSSTWTVNPTPADVGTHAVTITVRDADASAKVIESAKTTLVVSPQNAGAAKSVRMLLVGDSLTAATLYPNELARLLNGPGNPQWSMVGTVRPPVAAPGVVSEGYGGWTWRAFLSPPSPFLFQGDGGATQLDVERYVKDRDGGAPPDVVTFQLGINDCIGADPDNDVATEARITAVLADAERLIAGFSTALPNATIGIGLTTPPNASESAFVATYGVDGKFHRWPWKRVQHRLVERMIEQFSNRAAERIKIIPTNVSLDTVGGYDATSAIHPNATGYAQIGASFYAWIKAL